MFKPIYYITSALLFGAACLSYSCSSNFSEPQTNPPAQAEDEILSVFLDLNKSFKPEVQRRSESFDKGLAIVLADAFGAKEGSWFGCKVGKFFGPKGVIVGGVAGATIFGAAASYVAYKEKYSNNSQLLSITSQKSE